MRKKRICVITIFAIAVALFALFSTIPFSHAQTQSNVVSLSPSSIAITSVNGVFDLTINASNVQGLWGWDANITWNKQYLSLTTVTEGDFLSSQVGGSGSTFFTELGSTFSNSHGYDIISDAGNSNQSASGSGTLATLEFTSLSRFGQTTIQANFDLLSPIDTTKYSGAPNPIITSSTSQTIVTLQTNLPPEAEAGPDQAVRAGTQVVLNASQSICNGNNPTYTWSFLDGVQQNLTGITATYTFNNVGSFIITLTVQDSLGSSTATETITVINSTFTPPTITISGTTPGKAIDIEQPVTFTVDQSSLRDVNVANYSWSMGDQSAPTITDNGTITYAYSAAGTYTVNVTISYSDGINDFATTNITIGYLSTDSPTPALSSNPSVTSTDSPNPNSSNGSGATNGSIALPPTILGIIVAMTMFVLVGSVFWLRNQKFPGVE